MPRAETSPAGRILTFFRTAPLDVAELVVQLAKDTVLERKRGAPKDAAAVAPPAAPAKPAAAPKKKRSHHKRKAAPAPVQPMLEEIPSDGEAADAPPAPAPDVPA